MRFQAQIHRAVNPGATVMIFESLPGISRATPTTFTIRLSETSPRHLTSWGNPLDTPLHPSSALASPLLITHSLTETCLSPPDSASPLAPQLCADPFIPATRKSLRCWLLKVGGREWGAETTEVEEGVMRNGGALSSAHRYDNSRAPCIRYYLREKDGEAEPHAGQKGFPL